MLFDSESQLNSLVAVVLFPDVWKHREKRNSTIEELCEPKVVRYDPWVCQVVGCWDAIKEVTFDAV